MASELVKYNIPFIMANTPTGEVSNEKTLEVLNLKLLNKQMSINEYDALVHGILNIKKKMYYYFDNSRSDEFKNDCHYSYNINRYLRIPSGKYKIDNENSEFNLYSENEIISYHNFYDYKLNKRNVKDLAPGEFPKDLESGKISNDYISSTLNIGSNLFILYKKPKNVIFENQTFLVDSKVHEQLKLVYENSMYLKEGTFIGFVFLFANNFGSVLPFKNYTDDGYFYDNFYIIHYYEKSKTCEVCKNKTKKFLGMVMGLNSDPEHIPC
jgi:hypothetical protein